MTFDIEEIKLASRGREAELLEYVGHIGREYLSGKHCPCPGCGGKDRARFDRAKGFFICNKCFDKGNGDILAAIGHFRKIPFSQVLAETAYRLGIEPTNGKYNGKPTDKASQGQDPLIRMAEVKRCPLDGLKAYGGIGDPSKGMVFFPMYRVAFPSGKPERCSTFFLWPDSEDAKKRKGKNAAGKPSGMFFPHNEAGQFLYPEPGDTWIIVEGPKDASVLRSMGYYAIGLPGKSIKDEWLPLFQGVDCVLCFDNDPPGKKATPAAVAKLQTVASSVKVVQLPAPDDIRDNIAAVGVDAVKAAIESAGDDSGQEEAPPEPLAFTRLIAFDDFLEMTFDDDEIIPGVFVGGQPGVLGARLKCMKSHMALELAVSLASQTPFCGHFPVKRECRVGVWSGESGRKKVQRILRAQREAHGIDRPIPLFLNFSLPKLSTAEHLEALHEVIQENKLDVCILDPLYMALLTAANASLAGNVFAMGVILEPLAQLGQESNCSILTAHHFKKNAAVGQDEPCSLEELSQAGVAEWAGQWLLLARRTPYASDGKHELFMRVGGRAGFASFWALDIDEGHPDEGAAGQKWDVSIRPVSDAKAESREAAERKKVEQLEKRDAEDRRRILEAARRCPEGETQNELCKLAGLSKERGANAIRSLLGEERVKRVEILKNKRQETGYVQTGK